MHLTVRAKGLGFHKGAFVRSQHCIVAEFLTLGTEFFFCTVLFLTVKLYHKPYDFLFMLSFCFNSVHLFFLFRFFLKFTKMCTARKNTDAIEITLCKAKMIAN